MRAVEQKANFDPGKAENLFMKLILGYVTIYHRGSVSLAVQAVNEIRAHLGDRHVDTFDGPMVTLTHLYFATAIAIEFYTLGDTRYADNAYGTFPKAAAPSGFLQWTIEIGKRFLYMSPFGVKPRPWDGLHSLYYSLLRRHRYQEAVGIVHTVSLLFPAYLRPKFLEIFARIFSRGLVQIHENTMDQRAVESEKQRVLGTINGWIASSIVWHEVDECRRKESAEYYIQLSRHAFDKCDALTDISEDRSLSDLLLDLQFTELRLIPETNIELQLAQGSRLLDLSVRAKAHSLTDRLYPMMLNASGLRTVHTESPLRMGNIDEHLPLLLQQSALLLDEMESITEYFQRQEKMLVRSVVCHVDVNPALEWCEAFTEENPEFSLPICLIQLENLKIELYALTSQLGKAGKANTRRNEIEQSFPQLSYKQMVANFQSLISTRAAEGLAKGSNLQAQTDFLTAMQAERPEYPEDPEDTEDLEDSEDSENSEDSEDSEPPEDPSDPRRPLCCIFLNWINSDLSNGLVDERTAIELLTGASGSRDAAANLGYSAVGILDLDASYVVRSIFGKEGRPIPQASWVAWDSNFRQWLERYHSRDNWQHLYAGFRLGRANMLLNAGDPEDLLANPQLHRERLEEGVALMIEITNQYSNVGLATASVDNISRGLLAISLNSLAVVSGKPLDDTENKARIQLAQDYGKQALDLEQQTGFVREALPYALLAMGTCALMKHISAGLFEEDPEWDSKALGYLHRAMQCLTDIRQSSIAEDFKGNADPKVEDMLSIIAHNDSLISSRLSNAICHTAFQIIYYALANDTGAGDCLRTARLKELWNWVQCHKSRTIVDLMSLRTVTPQGLLYGLNENSREQLSVGQALMRKIANYIPATKRFLLRKQFRLWLKDMKELQDPALRQILDLKDGTPLVYDHLRDLVPAGIDAGQVLFIDYYSAPKLVAGDPDIFMLVAKAGEIPQIYPLVRTTMGSENPKIINRRELMRFIEASLNEIHLRDTDTPNPLQRLNFLAHMLTKISNPGDILVICPTLGLHRLPFHALEIEPGTILLERNPVVYTYSFSVFRFNRLWSQEAGEVNLGDSAVFAAEDYPAGVETVEQLANRLGTRPHIGPQATRGNFLQRLKNANLVHYYGHANYASEESAPGLRPIDILRCTKHHLNLFPDNKDDPNAGRLEARELLGATTRKGTHVSLIACETGGVSVGELIMLDCGDEVMGLVPAFLCCGASSAIASLWRVTKPAGVAFTKEFYALWDTERTGDMRESIHLARAFQKAVLRLRENWQIVPQDGVREEWQKVGKFVPVYYWASFVLHGWWEFKFEMPPSAQED